MNNRDYGVWLIPVLAALALYVPFTTGTKPQPVISSPLSPETTAAGGQQGREIASAGLLPEFLGTNDLATTISQSQKTSITFVIATVPDPRDSSLGYIYDRHLAAIQLASQRADYVLDRFDLPWNDKEDKTIQQGKTIEKYKLDRLGVRKLPEENDQKTQRQPLPRHQREAGLILFRQPFGEETHKKILLLFLVGETPTSGIHKSALIDALKQIHWLCTTLDRQQNPECQSLPVLAPTFSGSIDSIITALEKWRGDSPKWPKRFNMISGSATAINKKRDRLTELGTDFHATVAPDDEAFGLLVKYLTSIGAKEHQIARLVEGATGYGQTYLRDPRESTEHVQDVLTLSYPLHISQLRQAAEKARGAGKEPLPETPSLRPRNLRLSLEESNDPKDVVPPSSRFDTFSVELILSNILSTISRERIRYWT